MRRRAVLVLLGAALATPAAAQTPKVWLNHLYAVVDSETYHAIETSDFVRNELAGFEQRTTRSGDRTAWTGTYLYGEHTYLELFQPVAKEFTRGDVGVGLGVERRGELAAVRAKLAAALHTSVDTLRRTRVVGTDTIPWFQAVGIAPDTSAHLSTWYMEYDPDYVGRAFPEVPPARRGITRAAVLAPRFDSTRLLGDITGATLALNEGERAQFVAELRALGYSIRTRGGATIAAGPGVTFAFVPATAGRHGLRELRLSLRRRPEPRVITLGTSELRLLRDGTAAWTF